MKTLFALLLLPFLLSLSPTPKEPKALESPKEKPAMKLGQLSQISTTTTDLETSIAFWKKLGFRVVMQDKTPTPWAQLTDESVLIYIAQNNEKFLRLTYFTNDYEGTLKNLKKAKVKLLSNENDAEGKPWRAIFKSPDGQEISIVNRNPAMMYHPTAKTMLTMDQKDMMKGENMPTKLGMFGEFCHKISDIKASMAYWEKLGFKSTGLNLMPYPWTVMTDGMSLVGLHKTTDWDGAAITYFAPDMGKRLEGLKAEGIVGKEIGMGPNNVIVTTPEGIQLFLFSMF